ncbi:MAG: asparagine synthase-related protein, partial [Planctomycetota bacterium]
LRPAASMTYESKQKIPDWVTRPARRRFAKLRAEQIGPIIDRRNTAGAWMAEQWQAAGSAADQGYGVFAYETRFPFLHKPLAESFLRMPWSTKVRPNCNKLLLRRLAKTLLPPGFATRASPGVDQAVGHALAAQSKRIQSFTEGTALGQLGLIDESQLQSSVSQVQNGFGRGLRFIVMTLAMELWTRSVLSGDWRRHQLQNLWPQTTTGE